MRAPLALPLPSCFPSASSLRLPLLLLPLPSSLFPKKPVLTLPFSTGSSSLPNPNSPCHRPPAHQLPRLHRQLQWVPRSARRGREEEGLRVRVGVVLEVSWVSSSLAHLGSFLVPIGCANGEEGLVRLVRYRFASRSIPSFLHNPGIRYHAKSTSGAPSPLMHWSTLERHSLPSLPSPLFLLPFPSFFSSISSTRAHRELSLTCSSPWQLGGKDLAYVAPDADADYSVTELVDSESCFLDCSSFIWLLLKGGMRVRLGPLGWGSILSSLRYFEMRVLSGIFSFVFCRFVLRPSGIAMSHRVPHETRGDTRRGCP